MAAEAVARVTELREGARRLNLRAPSSYAALRSGQNQLAQIPYASLRTVSSTPSGLMYTTR